jgi:hypothetical protein
MLAEAEERDRVTPKKIDGLLSVEHGASVGPSATVRP